MRMVRVVNCKVGLLVTALGLFLAMGCEGEPPPEPDPPTPHDKPATLGNTEVTVVGTEVKTPDFVDSNGQSVLVTAGSARVFAVKLSFKNTGDAPIPYSPRHNAASGQADTTPLLFKMPAEGEKLTPIPNLRLGDNIFTTDQVQIETDIEPGKAVVDEYLFKIPPPDDKELLLTVPATLFGGDAGNVARFALPNEPKTIAAPSPGDLETPVTRGNVKVSLTSVADEYIEAEKIGQEAEKKLKYPYAYTVEPVLKVGYQIVNNTNKTVVYTPGHRALDSAGVELFVTGSREISLSRFKLADADAAPKGQMKGCPCQLEPGKTYDDFMLFQRPSTASKTELLLRLSGHIFDTRGLYEFKIPYELSEPSQPDLEPYKKEKPPEPAPE